MFSNLLPRMTGWRPSFLISGRRKRYLESINGLLWREFCRAAALCSMWARETGNGRSGLPASRFARIVLLEPSAEMMKDSTNSAESGKSVQKTWAGKMEGLQAAGLMSSLACGMFWGTSALHRCECRCFVNSDAC